MKLEITKEKVLEAAGKCAEAKAILETLFPEVFIGKKKHPYGTGRVYIDDDCNEIYFEIASGNNDWTNCVIDHIRSTVDNPEKHMWSKIIDNATYLGYRFY